MVLGISYHFLKNFGTLIGVVFFVLVVASSYDDVWAHTRSYVIVNMLLLVIVVPFLFADGKMFVTDIVSYTGGNMSGVYVYNGTTYYSYPNTEDPPSLGYAGIVNSAGRYYIPVVASFHTHPPCRSDGTDGTSHTVSVEVRERAATQSTIRHWVVGCGSVCAVQRYVYLFF